jgi:hypothetical protein
LIDCSFGVFGVIPLLYCLRLLRYIAANRFSFRFEVHQMKGAKNGK